MRASNQDQTDDFYPQTGQYETGSRTHRREQGHAGEDNSPASNQHQKTGKSHSGFLANQSIWRKNIAILNQPRASARLKNLCALEKIRLAVTALGHYPHWLRGTTRMMTKLEAIVQPNKFEAVKEALSQLGVEGMTISEVRGHGRQKGHTEHYRGREYSVDLVPKIKIEVVLADQLVERAVEAVITAAATGKIGDGKIFLYKIDDAIRIRSQERGATAI
jgi:nitrogen regulatory protein P-II 1